MLVLNVVAISLLTCIPSAATLATSRDESRWIRRTSNTTAAPAPIVDLGYARYQGSYSPEFDLNIYKGIRYAAPPIGKSRWQAPQAPELSTDRSIVQAVDPPPLCPQSGANLPKEYGFLSGPGDEDCLFLNVYAPRNKKKLPVFLWIHGGGNSLFGAVYDPSQLIKTNGNGFIVVEIQYRLGAFGYLSSEDVKKNGKLNAGLLDQRFALEWVQKNIQKFGGDPKKVTIGGESSGAGSVMLQAMAYGGRQNPKLFDNIIAASVYVPRQYKYNDQVPSQYYQDFATEAGCDGQPSVFNCLVNADTAVLQNASAKVSESGDFGIFPFGPVTDGDFIQAAPSEQLLNKAVSGKRLLVGNNANEGAPLTLPTIKSISDLLAYVSTTFPRLLRTDLTRVLDLYQIPTLPGISPPSPLFDTLGDSGPTALTVSAFGAGPQQSVLNLNGEITFVCPGYWLADAFTGRGRQAWKYQYSVTSAYHGADLSAYFSVGATTPTPEFISAFQKIWGHFIINNTPVISVTDASGNTPNATVPIGNGGNIDWPSYSERSPLQMDLNTTGGTVTNVPVTPDYSYNIREGPGVANVFRLVDANKWEGGRGERCKYWQQIAPRVPQ